MHSLITKKVIETIHHSEGRELLLRDTELKGFGIRISPSGTKTFFAEGNFNRSRQTKRRSLGRYPVVTLDTARAKARELLCQWYIGMDIEKQDMKTAQEAVLLTLCNISIVIFIVLRSSGVFGNRSERIENIDYRRKEADVRRRRI
jgi:hypothetical protein